MPSLLSQIRSRGGGKPSGSDPNKSGLPRHVPVVVATEYSSHAVDIPASFLGPLSKGEGGADEQGDASKRSPSIADVSVKKVEFATNGLPAYEGMYAVVIDGLLSSAECDAFIDMTEQSAGKPASSEGQTDHPSVWRTAMVNAGVGREFLATDYRHSERIIWDSEELTRRLWARVIQIDEVARDLASLDPSRADTTGAVARAVLGNFLAGRNVDGERWECAGANERMRVLKYGPGMFFKPHCDGTFERPNGERSFLTLHLYLNDSTQASEQICDRRSDSPSSSSSSSLGTCTGGATTFHSLPSYQRRGVAASKAAAKGKNQEAPPKDKPKDVDPADDDKEATLDVDPVAGRVLIFQHRGLRHSGAEVLAGTKYTMRTDVLYRFVEAVVPV